MYLQLQILLIIYILIYFARLSVRLYLINVKTAEPIERTFFGATHVTSSLLMVKKCRLSFLKMCKFKTENS